MSSRHRRSPSRSRSRQRSRRSRSRDGRAERSRQDYARRHPSPDRQPQRSRSITCDGRRRQRSPSRSRRRRSLSCHGRDGRAHDRRAAGHVAMSSCTGLLPHPCLYDFSLNSNSCLSFVSGPVVDHQKNSLQYSARQVQQKLKADYFAEHKKQPRTGQEALRDATAQFFAIHKLQLQQLECKIDLFAEMVQTGWLTKWTKTNVDFAAADFYRTVLTDIFILTV